MKSNRKYVRVIRKRKLTAAEVARDKEIRRLVEAEFPPLIRPKSPRSDELKQPPSP